MSIVRSADALPTLGDRATSAANALEMTLLLEAYIEEPRHIEVQIVGDSYGRVIHALRESVVFSDASRRSSRRHPRSP